MKHLIITFCLVFLTLQPVARAEDDPSAPDWTPTLDGAVGANAGIGMETYYKFSFLIHPDGTLSSPYFQNVDRFELHQQFLATLPEFKGMTGRQIDEVTYSANPVRRAFTGVLVIRSGDDGVFRSRFSLAVVEVPEVRDISLVAQAIKKSVDADRLGTILEFELLPHQVAGFAGRIPALKQAGLVVYVPDYPANNVSYTNAWNFGKLVHIADQADLDAKVLTGEVGADTIVWADIELRAVPQIAGLISSVPLSPASHSVLLAQMYGTPVVYFKAAARTFTAHVGQTLFLQANGSAGANFAFRQGEFDFALRGPDIELLKQMKARVPLKTTYDPVTEVIADVKTLTRADIPAYGGKASQLGNIMRTLPENSIREGLAVPIRFGIEFFATALSRDGKTLREFIDGKLATIEDLATPRATVRDVTAQIQTEILFAKFPEARLAQIAAMIETTFPGDSVKLRLRSTSPVEDGPEFNGAGLYDSYGYWLRGGKKDNLEFKVKAVLSSLYTERAFLARRAFGVDESRVGMGIVIHRAFLNEDGNGVIRLKWDGKGSFDFEVSTLPGEDEEVTAGQEEGSTEVVVGNGSTDSEWGFPTSVRVQQPYKGFSKERTLFPSQTYLDLTAAMLKLAADYRVEGQEVDIESEFKIYAKEGEVPRFFIKQVRPVPHPRVSSLKDGSKFLILGAEKLRFTTNNHDFTNPYWALWLPSEAVLSADAITETDLKNGKVSIREISYTIRGQTFTIENPQVSVEPPGDSDYPYYRVTVPLANSLVKGLKLTFSVSTYENLAVRTFNGFNLGLAFEADPALVPAMKALKWDFPEHGPLTSENAYLEEGRATDETGWAQISSKDLKKPITVTSPDTYFTGEADGHSVHFGATTVEGIWKRPLHLPSSAIGYGANHHQGDESFAVDLFGDPTLTDKEKKDIESKVGRYLFAIMEGYEGGRLVGVSEKGKIRKFGDWELTAKDRVPVGH